MIVGLTQTIADYHALFDHLRENEFADYHRLSCAV